MDEFAHYGVLGMKWGVRRTPEQLGHKRSSSDVDARRHEKFKYESTKTVKTSSGTTISISKTKDSAFSKFLGKHSKRIAEEQSNTLDFSIKDSDGKSIGNLELYKESKDSINITWIGIKSSERGNGYASAVMNSVVQLAKETGCKTVTLEVPGDSPDARHIYEKIGFKEVDSPDRDLDDVWGGLTNMRLDLTEIKHGSDDTSLAERLMDLLKQNLEEFEENDKTLSHRSTFAHYGILGMKWGVRRTPEQLGHKPKVKGVEKPLNAKDIARGKHLSDETKRFIESAKQVDRSIGKFYKKPIDLSKMSDDDLRKYVQRMNLERQYRQLSSEDVSKGKASVNDILDIAGSSVGIVSSSLAIAIAIKQLSKENRRS